MKRKLNGSSDSTARLDIPHKPSRLLSLWLLLPFLIPSNPFKVFESLKFDKFDNPFVLLPDSDVLSQISSGPKVPPIRFWSSKVHPPIGSPSVAKLHFFPSFIFNNFLLAPHIMLFADPSLELTYWGSNIMPPPPPQSLSSHSLFPVCTLSTQSLSLVFAVPVPIISSVLVFTLLLAPPPLSESYDNLFFPHMALVYHLFPLLPPSPPSYLLLLFPVLCLSYALMSSYQGSSLFNMENYSH